MKDEHLSNQQMVEIEDAAFLIYCGIIKLEKHKEPRLKKLLQHYKQDQAFQDLVQCIARGLMFSSLEVTSDGIQIKIEEV